MNKVLIVVFLVVCIAEAATGNLLGARIDMAMIAIIATMNRVDFLHEATDRMLDLLGEICGVDDGE